MVRTIAIALCCLCIAARPGRAAEPKAAAAVDLLRQAAEAYAAERPGLCARILAPVTERSLGNPDALLFLRGQCRFYAGDPAAAQADFTRLASAHRASPHASLAGFRAADCRWRLGQRERAAKEYARLARAGRNKRVDAAVGLQRRALVAYAAKQDKLGDGLWFALRRDHPGHPLAAPAAPGRQEQDLSFAESLTLAEALNKAKRWDEGLEVLDAAIEPRSARQRFDLALLNGRILFDMRFHYEEAARLLLAARDQAPDPRAAEEAWFFGSRALGRADRDDQAIASHLAMVAKHPRGRFADRALYYAAWLAQNQGRCAQAAPLFARLAKEYPDSEWNKDARWFTAWCHLQSGAHQQAIAALASGLTEPGFRFGGRARYWTAMAQRALGQEREATANFTRVIADHPLTWYARLSRLRLGDAAPPEPKVVEPSRSPGAKGDRLLERADELTRAGLPGFASLLLRSGEKRFLARHPGRAGRLVLMDAFRRAGDFNRPWFLTLVRERSALDRLPAADTRAIWEHAYPPCRRTLLEQHAGGDGELVLLLQAIMRTESGFDENALSVADARGLMQMIPPTASEVARRLDMVDYSDDLLFDPQINVRTAAWYIGGLVHKFKRQWPLAAGAYNGGPPAMMRWCREMGKLELDAFVESIPYTETRRYMKRVLTAMLRYAFLEGRPLPALRLDMDPAFLAGDPDF